MIDADMISDDDKNVSDRSVPGDCGGAVSREMVVHRNAGQVMASPLFKSIAAMNRQLDSSPLSKSIATMNRLLDPSPLSKSIATMNRLLDPSPLSKSIATMNRLLDPSPLSKSIVALDQPAVTLPTPKVKKPLDVRAFTAFKFTRKSVTTREGPKIWLGSDVAEIEDPLLGRRKQYWLMQFDAFVKDDGLRDVCRRLFADGHYTIAVEKACTYIDNMVGRKSGRADKDGADLMRTVFSPRNPMLRLNELATRSDRNEQQGYMDIFAGIMTGIRNPRAHKYNLEDSPEEALERLVMANHLMRMLNRATLA